MKYLKYYPVKTVLLGVDNPYKCITAYRCMINAPQLHDEVLELTPIED